MIKEAIRRVYYGLCFVGLASEEIACESGTLKYRFLDWLYGNAEPQFATQWNDDEPR